MKKITFKQVLNDRIAFVTDENSDRSSLSYKKFCEQIFKYPIKNPGGLQDQIDTFHTVFLDTETGEWERIYSEHEEVSFEQMIKLNPCLEEKAKIESDKENREVNLTKNYFEEVWNKKRSNLFKKYGN